ncbi:hypothetical protein ASE10_17825 [Lysobacter sp. Root76]|nr:hypothetical protein ASE10_17825 [Lysobacter sp. Root76]KRD65485.1 hypothetical protein ASE45_19020 [Lysobacter sp. Root96]
MSIRQVQIAAGLASTRVQAPMAMEVGGGVRGELLCGIVGGWFGTRMRRERHRLRRRACEQTRHGDDLAQRHGIGKLGVRRRARGGL